MYSQDFYVVYDEDAEFVADEFYHSRTVLKTLDVAKKTAANKNAKLSGPSYINLSQTLAETVVRTLIHEKLMRVEIYSIGDDRKWYLYRKGSPGNVQQLEDLLFARTEVQESPIMMALTWSTVSGGQRMVGVSLCDALMKKLFVCEFLDSENFSNLESLVVQVGAKECYVPPLDAKDKDASKILEILERCQVVIDRRKKSDFDARSIDQDLRTLLGKHYVDAHADLELKHAMSATACILLGLELLSMDANLGNFRIFRYDLLQYMRLDAAAVQALNLVPNPRDGNQQYNLFALLNKCKTPMGARKLQQWIKQPLVSLEAIKRRHNMVEVFAEDTALLGEVRRGLQNTGDVERITKKLQRGKATLQDCVLLYNFADKLPRLKESLLKYSGGGANDHEALIKELFIDKIDESKDSFERYASLIAEVIDMKAIEEGEYMISASFDDVLRDLDLARKEVRKKIQSRGLATKTALGADVNCEYDKVYGWIFRVTKKDEKILDKKENKTKYTVVANVKSGIKFQDATLKSLSDEMAELTQSYNDNCKDIIKKVMEVVRGYLPLFEQAQELVSELDVFASFAEVVISSLKPYVRPLMHAPGTGDTKLLQCRHAILEANPEMKFIPNDCILERGKSSFIIITGPNMGGKSTYIRQVGLTVLMAQIGCFVPCDEGTEICISDAILARVGAGDSQLRGVSTFMAEMLETATILKTATKDSLVIIDELGRGTSTYDGFGLAWAISEYLAGKVGCMCLFATHFHELTQLAEEMQGVTNKHVSAVVSPDAGLVLQYTIADGPSDQSFGIHVAKLANFPDSVVQIATQKAAELESFDESAKRSSTASASSNAMQVDNPAGQIEEEAKADKFISAILHQFSDLPIDEMSPEEAQEALQKLKQQIDACDVPLVQQLLANDVVN